MNRIRIAMVAILALAVMAGCASTSGNEQWLAMEQARQGRMDTIAAQCETDLCLVMVAQESNQITRPPGRSYHPIWSIVGQALNVAIPAYAGIRNTEAWGDVITGVGSTIAAIDRADNSVSIGGDSIGGNRIDDRSVGGDSIGGNYRAGDDVGGDQAGRDYRSGDDVGGDQAGRDYRSGDDVGRDQAGRDYRSGDDVSDGCIGANCRSGSDGPIDNSDPGDDGNDNSDNSDNSGTDPAPADPGG